MLIKSIESALRVLLAYVDLNNENQQELFKTLKAITKLCFAEVYTLPRQPLDWPPRKVYPKKSPNSTATICRLAKRSIIEMCRGNPTTSKGLPLNIFEMFANFIDKFEGGDPTASPDLDFFFVAANPTSDAPIRRNQNHILGQLLRVDLKVLRSAVKKSMFLATSTVNENSSPPCENSLRMISLIRKLADNYKAVQRLSQEAGMTILALTEELALLLPVAMPEARNRRGSIASISENKEEKVETALQNITATSSGLSMLIGQAEGVASYLVTVLEHLPRDPEIIRNPILWNFLSSGALPAVAKYTDPESTNKDSPSREHSDVLCYALLKIVCVFMREAAGSGLLEEIKHERSKWRVITSLCGHANTLLESCGDEHRLSYDLEKAAYDLVLVCGFNPKRKVESKTDAKVQVEKKCDEIEGSAMRQLRTFVKAVELNPYIQEKVTSSAQKKVWYTFGI